MGTAPGSPSPPYLCVRRAESQGSLKEEGLWLGNQSLLSHYQNVLQQSHQPLTVSRRDAVKVQRPRLLSRQRCTFPTGPEGGRKTTLSPVSPYCPSSVVPEEPHMLYRNPAQGLLAGKVQDLSDGGAGGGTGRAQSMPGTGTDPRLHPHGADVMPQTPGRSWSLLIGFLPFPGGKFLLPPQLFMWKAATFGGLLFQAELPKSLGLVLKQDQTLEILQKRGLLARHKPLKARPVPAPGLCFP